MTSTKRRAREAGEHDGRFVIPVTVDDLAANGLLGEADPQTCWERSVETLTARKDDIAGLAVASDERIEAYLLVSVRRAVRRVVSLRSFVEDGGARLRQLLARLRARGVGTLRFSKVHPAEISTELLETLGFRPAGRHLLYAATARTAAPGCPVAGDVDVKSYHDIAGDGGSRVLEQVAEQRARITDGLAGVRHLVAVGSGKGGVGKSTLTLHLAGALRARGLRIAILDADFNGPSQARMAGVQGALFVPGSDKVALPRTSNGIGVFSMGSVDPGVGGARVRERGARRIAHVARHAGSSRSSARSSGPSSGARSTCCCSTCRPEPSGPSSTPISSGRGPRSCW